VSSTPANASTVALWGRLDLASLTMHTLLLISRYNVTPPKVMKNNIKIIKTLNPFHKNRVECNPTHWVAMPQPNAHSVRSS
jgi:hypothetical protein